MFTGIIDSLGVILEARQHGDLRVTIGCGYDPQELRLGESIACNGACLTVVEKGIRQQASRMGEGITSHTQSPLPNAYFTVTLSAETIARTAPGQWQEGKRVNLERSLRLGDRLDGHLVTGHVDGLATLISLEKIGDSHRLGLEAPSESTRFIAEKGSVTLDGVSLTINQVVNSRFWVNIIPHTWQATTLSERLPGDGLNLEIDMIARYTARLLHTSL